MVRRGADSGRLSRADQAIAHEVQTDELRRPFATLPDDVDRFGTVFAAVSAGVGGAVASASPTGTAVWDGALCAGLALAVVLAASRAPRWQVVALGTLAAALGGWSLWGLVGWASLLVATSLVVLPRRSQLVAAIAAGLAVQTLLRLPAFGFFGLPSLITGAAFLVVLASGYRSLAHRQRKRFRAVAVAITAAAVSLSVIGAVTMLDARSEIESGIDAAQRALEAGRLGDAADASNQLSQAETLLQSANQSVSGPAPRFLRLLPIAAQHQRTIEEATSIGADIASQATTMVTDLEAIDASLQAGSVDLAVLKAMAPRVRATADALIDAKERLARAESPWLLPAVSDRLLRLGDELDELLPEVELAANATVAIPKLLGIDEPQQYLVFFGTPAEAREFGGFVGSWALIEFDQSEAELIDSGRKFDLYPIANAATIDPATSTPWFLDMARPLEFPENLTSAPDFEFVADMTRQVLGEISDRPLAGLIYLDARALTAMLELTGPIAVPFQVEPLTPDNAERFFFHDQYDAVTDRDDRDELFDTLSEVAEGVLAQLTSTALPSPEELGRVLGPVARGGHLQIITFDDGHNDFLRSVKLLRDFGGTDTADFVALVHSNGLSNKMDLYLERTLDYSATVNDDGELVATATATLRSVVPADATAYALGKAPTVGMNHVLLSLYTPHALSELRVNGAAVEAHSTIEFGLARYLVVVEVAPTGEPYEITFDLTGFASEPYSLEVWRQPLVNTDQVTLHYDGSSDSLDWQGPLLENYVLGPAGIDG